MTPAVYTIAEACEVLACSRWTIARKLSTGQLTRIELSGQKRPGIRIPRAEVDALAKPKAKPTRRKTVGS